MANDEELDYIERTEYSRPSNRWVREETIFKINEEAAKEIIRQLQLRNITGMIIIDFINMKNKESEKTLISHLKTCISKDPVKTIFVDLTGLGLAEMTRQKIEKPLNELFYEKTSGKND